MEGFIAYYRVSTARQGNSGLGLEAQKNAVLSFLPEVAWQTLKHIRNMNCCNLIRHAA